MTWCCTVAASVLYSEVVTVVIICKMKITSKLLVIAAAMTGLSSKSFAQSSTGWQKLFDGKTTQGWHAYLKQNAGPWKVVGGALQLDTQAPNQADLVTNDEFENYELSLDWKIAAGGNSGVVLGVHESPELNATYLSGIEMQVLDNKEAEDNKKENHLAGSLYDLKAAPATAAKAAGQWNHVVIRKDHDQLTFWLNNQKVIDVKIGGTEWNELLANSKFKTWKSFAQYPKGHIALQAHGAVVDYKNIRIKQL
jgi:hypothetical protein